MADSVKKEAWACGKCGMTHLNKYTAEICCKEYNCEVCGVKTRSHLLICDDCQTKRRIDKAQLVEWDGTFFYDGNAERYFSCWDSFFDYYEEEDLTIPEFVFACFSTTPRIDSHDVVNDIHEEANLEDDRIDLVDEKELHDFIDAWNKKQTYQCYTVDYSEKIKVPARD